jgi:hypothetical protein
MMIINHYLKIAFECHASMAALNAGFSVATGNH